MTSRWDILQQGLSKEPRENVWVVAKFAISEVIMKHLQVIVARGKADHG